MNKTNCPNCGAPIESTKCPYCGTVFYDFATLSADEPVYIRLKINGKIHVFKGIVSGSEMTIEPRYSYLGFAGGCSMIRNGNDMTVDVRINVLEDDKGIILKTVEEDTYEN